MSYLKHSKLWKEVKPIIKFFEEKFGKTMIRAVGGCVRDIYMNNPTLTGYSISDIDFATKHTPERIIELCQEYGLTVIPTGLAHGTVTVVCEHGKFEVTTLRKDVSCDGRHAIVEWSKDWKEDAARRDFTMNAMYMNSDGHIFDFFGGKKDIDDRWLRYVGNPVERVKEDALRIIRAVRFYAKFGMYHITSNMTVDKLLLDVARERIWQEFLKYPKNPILYASEMPYDMLWPRINNPDIDFNKLYFYSRQIPVLSIAAMYDNLDDAENFANFWKLSRQEKEDLLFFVTNKFLSPAKIEKLFVRQCNTHAYWNGDEQYRARIRRKFRALGALLAVPGMDLGPFLDLTYREFPLTAEYVMSNTNLKPGPRLGKALTQMYNIWEDNNYNLTKDSIIVKWTEQYKGFYDEYI